jgi:NAD(P)H-nitrite reductase large subunit
MDYRARDFYERHGVETLLGVEATGLDVATRTVRTADGTDLAFGKLLIATGGEPIVPPGLPPPGERGVFTFTTWEDVRRIRAYLDDGGVERAVVLGGGLIGLKAVEALAKLGIETTLVELADRILSATFDDVASTMASRHLKDAGVRVWCDNTVADVVLEGDRVTRAQLRDGSEVPCELVICAIGVRPDLSLVASTPVRTSRGIVTDGRMQTGVPGVFAAGDVVETVDLLGGAPRPIPILPNAWRQGYVAGSNMAGADVEYAGGLAMNAIDILGLPTISVGLTSPDERCEVLSAVDEEERTYRKFVLRGGRLVGAIFIGAIDRAGIATGLIKSGIDVSGFKDHLLSQDFGIISLPREYRKHVVSGMGIEV